MRATLCRTRPLAATLTALLLTALALTQGGLAVAQEEAGSGGPGGGAPGSAATVRFGDVLPSRRAPAGADAGPRLEAVSRSASFAVPVAGHGTDTVWSAGASARSLQLHFSGVAPSQAAGQVPELDLLALNARVSHRIEGGDSWSVFLTAARTADSWSLGGADRDPTRYTGGFVYTLRNAAERERGEAGTAWGLGAAVTYVFGPRRAVPIVTYTRTDDPWFVNVRLPFFATVLYRLSDAVRVGGRLSAQGGEYTVSAPAVDTVRYSATLVGALLTFGRGSGPSVELEAGTSPRRSYQALRDGAEVLSLHSGPAPYAQAGLRWRW